MKDFFELYDLFFKIKEKGWVKSKRSGPGGIGYTFETLIGKEEDGFAVPDFKSIEIKTMRYNSRQTLHLFTLTPDGDYLFPIKRILDKLGYPSKWNPKYNVFMINASAKEYSRIGWSKKIKLRVDRKNQKIELLAFSHQGEKIDVSVSWSFEQLKKTIELKLKNLAVVKAKHKIVDNCEFFHYLDINFYKLRTFDTFISLIEKGIITINFNLDVFKSGRRIGQVHDHGTCFLLKFVDINTLYQQVKLDIFNRI